MAYEPERVVIELLAKNDQYDAASAHSAEVFEGSTRKIGKAGADAERVLENLRKKLESALAAGKTKDAEKIASSIKKIEDAARGAGVQVSNMGDKFKPAASKADASARQVQNRMRNLGFQIGDIGTQLSSGTSPFIVLAQQGPQVANALDGAKGAVGRFASFLSGPWGAAVLAGVTLLGHFILKNRETTESINDLVEKLKDNEAKTRDSEIANDIFATTLEGVTKAIREDEEALKNLNDQHKTAARIALENAIKRIDTLKGLRDETLATIEAAKAQIELNRARVNVAGNDPRISGPLNAESDAASQRIEDMEKRIGRIDGIIKKQEGRVAEALSHRVIELVGQQTDKLESIAKHYDDLIEAARKRNVLEGTVQTKLAAETKELERQKEAALEVERARKRAADAENRAGRQSGRQITVADARRIVASIGGTVTSGTRTAEHNKDVGGVPNSFHVKGQAIDIAKTAGLTLGKIVQAFEKEGVSLIEKLDEGDHFHIAFGKRGRAGPSDETLAKRALAAADAAERREQSFQNEKASLENGVVDARQALLTSAEEIAKLELDSIEISRAKYADNVASLVEQRKLTGGPEGEAAQLLKLNEERARLRKELVLRREDERKFRLQEQQAQNAVNLRTAGLQDQAELLRSKESVAKTQGERADIERKLLDLQFQEERIALQAVIAHNERLKLNKQALESERIEAEAAAQIAQIRLDSIDQRQANATEAGDRANASPLGAYFGDIQAEADDINTAFERIAAGGLQTFTDKLTDAIVNFTSLKDVARATLQAIVSDLVKLAIRLVINATIGKLLGTAATTATALQATAAATAWAPAAALASLATLGANAGPAAAALAATNALALGFAAASSAGGAGAGFAGGGRIYGPGSSTGDRVPLWGSPDEFMIKARSARALGYDTLEHINRTGKLPGFAEGGRVRTVAPMNMPAASPHRRGGFSHEDINSLRGVIGDAVAAGIGAMPDVNNFIGFDPAALLARALGTREGQKALVSAYGRNQTAIKAQR